MKRYGKALQFSLTLHALIFTAFASIGGALSALTAKPGLMPIEFDLESAETALGAPAASAQAAAPRQKAAAGAADTVQRAERAATASALKENPAPAPEPAAAPVSRQAHGEGERASLPGGGAVLSESTSETTSKQTVLASPAESSTGLAARTVPLSTAQQDGRAPGANTGSSGIAEGIRSRIEALKSYPFAARRRGIEGTVVISVKVNGTGDLIENRIQRSSGSPLLDESALTLIKRVFPYKPGAGREVELDIPITYRLKS